MSKLPPAHKLIPHPHRSVVKFVREVSDEPTAVSKDAQYESMGLTFPTSRSSHVLHKTSWKNTALKKPSSACSHNRFRMNRLQESKANFLHVVNAATTKDQHTRPVTACTLPSKKAKRKLLDKKSIALPAKPPSNYQRLKNNHKLKAETSQQQHQAMKTIDTSSKEHLEIKACMLARLHNLNINELHRIGSDLKTDPAKQCQATEKSIVIENERKKMQFLLDHFFSTNINRKHKSKDEEELMYRVIDDWKVEDNNQTSVDSKTFWEVITKYLEDSYIFNQNVLSQELPSAITTEIALDCLEKLAGKLPNFCGIIRVLHSVLKSSIYVKDESENSLLTRKTYFERVKEKENTIIEKNKILSTWKSFTSDPPTDRLKTIFAEIKNSEVKESALLELISMASDSLNEDFIPQALTKLNVAIQKKSSVNLVNHMSKDNIYAVLDKIGNRQLGAMNEFFSRNISHLENLMIQPDGNIVRRIMEKNPNRIAEVFCHRPSLTSRILESAPRLVEQIFEKNATLVANQLLLRNDLLLNLLRGTLNSNTFVLEQHLTLFPHHLESVLNSKPMVTASILNTSQLILRDILKNCKDSVCRIYLDNPHMLSTMCSEHPDLTKEVFCSDAKILSQALSFCPTALSLVLQSNPNLLVNISRGEPKILERILTSYPDMLLEPLQRNTGLLCHIISENSNVFSLQLLSELGLESDIDRQKKLIEVSTQTDTYIPSQQVANSTSKHKKKQCSLYTIFKKKYKTPWSMEDIDNFIPKLYAQKLKVDAIDDLSGLERDSLTDIVQDTFIQECGLKSAANKKFGGLVSGIKKHEKESTRIFWFGVFLGVIKPEKYNPRNIDTFLKCLQDMLPSSDFHHLCDSSKPYKVSLSSVKVMVGNTFLHKTSSEYRHRLLKIVMGLEKTVADEIMENQTKVELNLNIDEVMNAVMEVWLDYESSQDEEFYELFKSADEDGNGVLTYNEFEALVKLRSPTCDERTIIRMFNQCGRDNDQGEHEIFQTDFAVVMRAYKI